MTLLKNPAVLRLYRELVKEAEKFPQYNYRMYSLRKINDQFDSKKDLPESSISEFLREGQLELDRMKRMTTVASLYAGDKLIIEKFPDTTPQ